MISKRHPQMPHEALIHIVTPQSTSQNHPTNRPSTSSVPKDFLTLIIDDLECHAHPVHCMRVLKNEIKGLKKG